MSWRRRLGIAAVVVATLMPAAFLAALATTPMGLGVALGIACALGQCGEYPDPPIPRTQAEFEHWLDTNLAPDAGPEAIAALLVRHGAEPEDFTGPLLSAQPDTDRSKGAGEAPASRLRARIWVGSFPPCSTDMIVRIDFDPSGGMLSRTVESQPRGCM